MNPSEAKVFSSGISGFLSSKNRSQISYSRLDQMNDSIEFSNVNFQKDSTSLCAKLCYGLLGLMLLVATLGSAIFIVNVKHFTIQVQLKRGNVRAYRFDQELIAFGKEKITTTNMSVVIAMHVLNTTESDCWFGILLSLPKDKNKILGTEFFAFLARVTSASVDDGSKRRFDVFGKHKTSSELSFYIHNILRQLLPVIKVKIYEFILSKVSSSKRRIAVQKQGFLPGRVHVKRTMITKSDIVTVISKADPDDFEGFSSKHGETPVTSWELTYEETSVVNGKTGMLKRSDLSLSGFLPLGEDPTRKRRIMSSHGRGLAVNFRSVVKLLDESHGYVERWKTVVKNEKDISHPLNFDSLEQSPLVYFAPKTRKDYKDPLDELKELTGLSKKSTGRSSELPSFIKIVRPVTVNMESDLFDDENYDVRDDEDVSDNDDVSDNEDFSDNNDVGDNDDDNFNDEETNNYNHDYDDQNSDNGNEPSWSTPNYSPYGLGYEVRRKRSMEINPAKTKNKIRNTRHARLERETTELTAIWDELKSSVPRPNNEAPRVIHSSILGLDFRTEIDFRVHADNDGKIDGYHDRDSDDEVDDDEQERWGVTTAFRVIIGQYRITPFRELHTLEKIRHRLLRKEQPRNSRWTVSAGDFMMCVSLFYIQRLCTTIRLIFDVKTTFSMPRVFMSYPAQLTVHIGQTVSNNATISAHVSTWFQESGFYTKGTVAMATMPIKLSFRENRTPKWCVNGDLVQKMVRIKTVPLSLWNCSLDHYTLEKSCGGRRPDANKSLATFDLNYSSTEGTLFDNWHYPVRCQRDFP
ncbi:uncharacterized protein [Montipora capricornis]|uniref:uncharacterized protein n=1 Tax=Montipora capricornis TaxID=246305 RepID=UPI0035F195A7